MIADASSWREVASKLRSLVKRGDQYRLAEALGVKPSTLSRYLNGERVPADPVFALRLCSYLGVDLPEIVGEGMTASRTPASIAAPLKRMAKELSRLSGEANELVTRLDEAEKGSAERIRARPGRSRRLAP